MTPPERIVVHIGLHKTGTTYLQNVWRANGSTLLEQGIEFVSYASRDGQRIATLDLLAKTSRGYRDPRTPGAWSALVRGVLERGAPLALISDEGLSACRPRQVRTMVDSFPDAELSVVVTVRDLGRVIVSQWQEDIKNDHVWTWAEYADGVRERRNLVADPGRGFWRKQDVPQILLNWESALPVERIHVVTVPPPGSPPEELVRRVGAVVGYDAATLAEQPVWNNETVGPIGIEVIRRLNQRLAGRLSEPAYRRAVKGQLAPGLARRGEGAKVVLPAGEVAWVSRVADGMIAELATRGYPVVGDLQDLKVSRQSPADAPADVPDVELLEVALDALAIMTEEYATAWWQRRRAAIGDAVPTTGVSGLVRDSRITLRRKAVHVVDNHATVARIASRLGLSGRRRRAPKPNA
jgi:hypothetical protein